MAKNQTIQHKRSSVTTNKPATFQVAVGELALNFADKSIYTLTAGGTIIELARDVVKSAGAPATATTGDLWWDTTNTELKFYNGTSWNNISTAGPSVLPANTTVPVGTTGAGTLASPYSLSVSVGAGTSTILGIFTVTGLAPNQFVPILDTASITNGGRFSVNNSIADSTGKLVFTLKFIDYPTSSTGTNYTAAMKIGVGTVYINATASVASSFPQSINAPTDISTTSTSWTAPADTITATGSLLISTDNVTFSTGPLAITTGATLYTKWAGTAGSGIGIDGAHGSVVTGGLSSSSGAASSSSLTISKNPSAVAFSTQTGVGLSTAITSNTVTVSGVNSYVYLTSSNTMLASVSGGAFISVPASGATLYAVNGQTLEIRQTSSATTSTTTTVTINLNSTTASFAVTTTAPGTVNTPTINSPTNASTGISKNLTITSSAFATTGPAGTHLSTDWEIAVDAAFSVGVISLTASTTSLTTWSPSGLGSNIEYYVRVRYNSTTSVTSSWSTTVSFTTGVSFTTFGWQNPTDFYGLVADAPAQTGFTIFTFGTNGSITKTAGPLPYSILSPSAYGTPLTTNIGSSYELSVIISTLTITGGLSEFQIGGTTYTAVGTTPWLSLSSSETLDAGTRTFTADSNIVSTGTVRIREIATGTIITRPYSIDISATS
jgi:hypothetical protein